MASDPKYEYLETDPIKVPGQNYALWSCASPDSNQKADKFAMKLRGCFDTIENAREHASRLQKLDSSFDIYVVEMYNWVVIPPDPNAIQDQEHQDKWLNDFIKGHKEEQDKVKQHFEERKQSMLEDIARENKEKKAQADKAAKEEKENTSEVKEELTEEDPWMKKKSENKE